MGYYPGPLTILRIVLIILVTAVIITTTAQFGPPAGPNINTIRPSTPTATGPTIPTTNTATTTTATTTQQCEINDPIMGCTTCAKLISHINTELLTNVLPAAQVGCTKDYECSMQSVSTYCGDNCLQAILTRKSQMVSDKVSIMNQQWCDSTEFQSKCASQITHRGSTGTGSSNRNTGRSISCGDEESYSKKSTGTCQKRNRLVAAATEIFASPVHVNGIGSNPNGIDGMYSDPLTGILIATSTVPIPTSDNVSNVISNIPLPPGALAPPGTSINQN